MRKWLFHFIIVSLFLWSGLTLVHAADRGEIRSGETKIGLEIVAPSYMDTWTFYGNAGDRVLISAEKHQVLYGLKLNFIHQIMVLVRLRLMSI